MATTAAVAGETTRELLQAITDCPIAERCLHGEPLACSLIVRSQGATSREAFHVPEPWSGHIATAPILFLSSNPSIGETEAYPTATWTAADRLDFFEGRFDPRPKPWVDAHMRARPRDGLPPARGRGTRFWLAVRARAAELLGPDVEVQPGRDYALSEVVHCKSRRETGVDEALGECVERWLQPVVRVAGARVIVLLGARARDAFRDVYGMPVAAMTGPGVIEGRDRVVLQLPHPNARERRTVRAVLAPEEVTRVRAFLRDRAVGATDTR